MAPSSHHAADVGRDDLVNRSDLFDGLDQRLQQLRVRAVRHEDPELAPREGFWTRQYAQRRGRRKLLPSWARGLRRIGHFKPQAVSDARRERIVDVQEMRHHPRADVRALDLAQLEDERIADVLRSIGVWLMKNCRAWL